MTIETEVSTPVDEVTEDTSTIVEPVEETETSTVEPEVTDIPAETETQLEPIQQEQLYAGKYKSIEELEKGYNEAQKFVNKASEFEKKYNELLEKQTKEAERIQLEKLQQAQYRGFNSIEQQEIADKVQIAEFEYYVHNLNALAPEDAETARQCLEAYYQTANRAYLEQAKRYFSSDFIENVALSKASLERQLMGEYQTAQNQRIDKETSELANILKNDYADFLADLNQNIGKAQALKSFCDAGTITSREDMQVFSDIYSQIAKYEREQAIKEFEAQKVIEETKNKANIQSGTGAVKLDAGLKDSYTPQEIGAMSQDEYNALCDKYGEDEITKRIL